MQHTLLQSDNGQTRVEIALEVAVFAELNNTLYPPNYNVYTLCIPIGGKECLYSCWRLRKHFVNLTTMSIVLINKG